MAHRDEAGVGNVHRARMAFFNHQQEFNKLSQQLVNGEVTYDEFATQLETLDRQLLAELMLVMSRKQVGGIDSEQPK